MPASPKNIAAALPTARVSQRSALLAGMVIGLSLVGIDVIGDTLSELVGELNDKNALAILLDELLHPSPRELWMRGFLFVTATLVSFMVWRQMMRQRLFAIERYIHLAMHDPLTNLPNRDQFLLQVQDEIAHARRHHSSVGVLLIGLDHFKLINDIHGHQGGDEILVAVAQRLRDSCAGAACVARLCSDHFALATRLPETRDRADAIAHDIQKAIMLPYLIDGKDVFITASVGITIFPDDGDEADKILHRADHAMCQAKKVGRGQICSYSIDLEHNAAHRLQIESGLRYAVERSELTLQYQPIVNPNTGETRSLEALLRWKRADGTMIPPLDFIPSAESSGLIVPIGEWVLRRACEDMRHWYDAGHTTVSVAVNISNQQLRHRDFVNIVQRAIRDSGILPTCLELEITESMLVHDIEAALKTLHALRELGIRFSIDDFGTGYSSMSYLGRLPVDCLKIDRSFVNDLSPRSGNEAIIKAVMALANELRIGVIAEGVETLEQLDFLRTLGCNAIQGYHFSRPVAHAAVSEILRNRFPVIPIAKAS